MHRSFKTCLEWKTMWGLKDAPRAFGMRLSRFLNEVGYKQGITDSQIWRKSDSKISTIGNRS
eukprot:7887620-Prorocentrum_lima.AAC.1